MGAFSNASFDVTAFDPLAFEFGTPVIVSQDCFVGFQGRIEDFATQGQLLDSLSFQGVIDDSSVALTGKLTAEKLVQGPLVQTTGLNGILQDNIAFDGDICED